MKKVSLKQIFEITGNSTRLIKRQLSKPGVRGLVIFQNGEDFPVPMPIGPKETIKTIKQCYTTKIFHNWRGKLRVPTMYYTKTQSMKEPDKASGMTKTTKAQNTDVKS